MLSKYGDLIIIGLALLWLILLILLIVVMVKLSRLKKRWNAVLGKSERYDLEDALLVVQQRIADVEQRSDSHDQALGSIRGQVRRMKAKSSIIRYNAFQETGSDLSFSIAVVDEDGNGYVITGIHNRHDTQVYAKPLEHGKSAYALSPEEIEAVNRALLG